MNVECGYFFFCKRKLKKREKKKKETRNKCKYDHTSHAGKKVMKNRSLVEPIVKLMTLDRIILRKKKEKKSNRLVGKSEKE